MLLYSIEQDSFLDTFAADGTLVHSITTHLTGTMSTQEDHVLKTIHTNWTACLKRMGQHRLIFDNNAYISFKKKNARATMPYIYDIFAVKQNSILWRL